jgi:hypothetical protein
MEDGETARVIHRYWSACNARDWAAFGEVLAADVVYEIPQTRERIRGRSDYVNFNASYPGDWHVDVVQVIGADRQAMSRTTFRVDGSEQTGLCLFEFDESGLICRIMDFWPEPYDPPPGREHLTERY